MQDKYFNKADNSWHGLRVMSELVQGYDTLTDVGKAVTIFGSARLKPNTKEYDSVNQLSQLLADSGYSIITGGGPGAMEAANKGAKESTRKDVKSIGLGITLPFEARNNEFVDYDYDLNFRYFFIRKLMLINYSDAFVAVKGGLGTLDEIFEVMTLMQTGKIKKRPIVFFGTEYWKPMLDMVKHMMEQGTVGNADLDNVLITDSLAELLEYIQKDV